MKIGRIVFFPCGVNVTILSRLLFTNSDYCLPQNLNRFRFPAINSASLTPWISAGLAVEADAGEDSAGIVFQLDWGTKEFNAFLRTLFPQLFRYLGTVDPHILTIGQEPDNVGKKRIDYSWPYVLLKKVRKQYEAVDNTHPTAITFRDNLSGGDSHTSFRGKGIFLGSSIFFHSSSSMSAGTRILQSPRFLFHSQRSMSGSCQLSLQLFHFHYLLASGVEVSPNLTYAKVS